MKFMGMDNDMNILSNIGLYKGEFKKIDIEITNEWGKKISLDTITVKLKICDLQDEDIIYVEKEGIASLIEESVSIVTLESSDTEDLAMSKYKYIVEIHYETGNKSIGKGYITIL